MADLSSRLRHGIPNLQAIIFSKKLWTPERALSLLKAHGHTIQSISRLHESANVWRYRELNPEEFKPGSFRTVKTRFAGVQAVYAVRLHAEGRYAWLNDLIPGEFF